MKSTDIFVLICFCLDLCLVFVSKYLIENLRSPDRKNAKIDETAPFDNGK